MFEMLENFFTVFGFICTWAIIAAWIISATHKVTKKPYPKPEPESIFTPEIRLGGSNVRQLHPYDQTKH